MAASRSNEQSVIWAGREGVQYRYWLSDIGRVLEHEPGNYMLIQEVETGTYRPLYIGEAADLELAVNGINSDPGVAAALAAGATKVCSHTTAGGVAARRIEARDLIATYDPPVNLDVAA